MAPVLETVSGLPLMPWAVVAAGLQRMRHRGSLVTLLRPTLTGEWRVWNCLRTAGQSCAQHSVQPFQAGCSAYALMHTALLPAAVSEGG
jgi:hypothetical protein